MGNKHFKCLLWKILWAGAFLSFLLAWAGFGRDFWLWNALVLGVLAIPIKLDCRSCKVCMVGE